jgi:hypothetical protein
MISRKMRRHADKRYAPKTLMVMKTMMMKT